MTAVRLCLTGRGPHERRPASAAAALEGRTAGAEERPRGCRSAGKCVFLPASPSSAISSEVSVEVEEKCRKVICKSLLLSF